MRIALIGLLAFYLLCCLGALGLAYAAEHRLLGLQPDPLAHVFAWALALPWSLLLQWPGGFGANAARGVLVAGMLSNLALGVLWTVRCRD